ncbi:MAG: hypothetical protein ABIJ96_17385 [Elusimicrobiota bacterium]
MSGRLPLGLLLAACFAAPAAAGTPEAPRIRDVRIERVNVFDPKVPGEDWLLFRIANRIHIPTRRRVILQENLLPPGSPWDPVKAIEIERNLRSLGFIRGAAVRSLPAEPGRIDLEIRSQDSWTLQPTLGVGTEGGDSYFVYGVEENNLLGLGKTVSFYRSHKKGERRSEATYGDPRVWGTRQKLTALYARQEEGDELGVRVDRPFFSFEAPFATDISWARTNEVNQLYRNGEEISEFNHNFHAVRSEFAARVGRSKTWVQRVHVGTIYERERFFNKAETAGGTLPGDRTLSGPMFGYSWIQPQYLRETNIDKMHRVEDFNLGNEFSAGVAPILNSWGADADRLMFSALTQQGYALTDGRFILGQVGTQGRLADGDRLENAMIFCNLNLFWKHRWPFPQTFVGHLEFNNAKNLDGEKQILLGGKTGLRGYKQNSFTGSRSILLNIENRFFYDREIMHLMHAGAVVFFDIGAVAREGYPSRHDQFKSDVGFGFRLSGSRAATGTVLRGDVAYALNRGPGPDRWVFSLVAGQGFAIFNSSNRQLFSQPDNALTDSGNKNRLIRR